MLKESQRAAADAVAEVERLRLASSTSEGKLAEAEERVRKLQDDERKLEAAKKQEDSLVSRLERRIAQFEKGALTTTAGLTVGGVFVVLQTIWGSAGGGTIRGWAACRQRLRLRLQGHTRTRACNFHFTSLHTTNIQISLRLNHRHHRGAGGAAEAAGAQVVAHHPLGPGELAFGARGGAALRRGALQRDQRAAHGHLAALGALQLSRNPARGAVAHHRRQGFF